MSEGPDEILRFWFGDATAGPEKATLRSGLWFGSSDKTDAEIKERFGERIEAARRGELHRWRNSAKGSLGLIILLDQFSRNVYRGSADAFSGDALARTVVAEVVEPGKDVELPLLHRSFLYLPFEHSESMEDQNRSVELFARLEAEAPEPWKSYFAGSSSYAKGHREIIARFGRFPYRNQVLGRADTPAERRYLRTADRFGQ